MTFRRLLNFLFPPRADEAVLETVTTDDFVTLLMPRLVPQTRPASVALLPFSDPRVRAAIHEAKYHGSARAFVLLSSALVEYLHDADDVGPRRSHLSLVPIPLGKERLRERGFNQTEEVAKRAADQIGCTLESNILVRTRETVSQVSLPRAAREENMRGAFTATRHAVPSHTYILIDDVMTTGATLQAAIDALKEAGAEHIIPLALAH